MKFVHALNSVVAYIGMEKFGNAQTVTTQRKTKKSSQSPRFNSMEGSFFTVMLICQYRPIHRILILRCSGQARCDLFESALYKSFVKFCKVSSLCIDEILWVGDVTYPLIALNSVHRCLLALFSKFKNLLGNFIVGFFGVRLFFTSSCWSSMSFSSILSTELAAETWYVSANDKV